MYSDTDIIAAVKAGKINITDFDPSPDPNSPLGPNSYDLRVSGEHLLEIVWATTYTDGKEVHEPWYIRQAAVAEGEQIVIPVGGTLLAMTIERVGMRGNITALMKARSSTGKSGMVVCKCAGLGDVGFDNHWTMEMTAFASHGQPAVTAGSRVAQMAFIETKSPPRRPYSGQYRAEDWPECMVPKKWRNHIVDSIADVPGFHEPSGYNVLPVAEDW